LEIATVSKWRSDKLVDATVLYELCMVLILIRIAVILVTTILFFFSNAKDKARGGEAIIIGFIPIVFVTDKESIERILLLSLLLIVVLAIMMVLHYLMSR
jgi:uncharacterized membrane protein